jgi:hypothetical protein
MDATLGGCHSCVYLFIVRERVNCKGKASPRQSLQGVLSCVSLRMAFQDLGNHQNAVYPKAYQDSQQICDDDPIAAVFLQGEEEEKESGSGF